MCETKPGPRCATDTRAAASDRYGQYASAHPDGPPVDPLAAATAQNLTPRAVGNQIAARHPGVQLWVSEKSNGTVVLNSIQVDPAERGKGRAEAAVADLTRVADEQGWTLALTPDNCWGSSKTRLTAWYRRHGFAPNKGRNRDFEINEEMYRRPEPATATTTRSGGR